MDKIGTDINPVIFPLMVIIFEDKSFLKPTDGYGSTVLVPNTTQTSLDVMQLDSCLFQDTRSNTLDHRLSVSLKMSSFEYSEAASRRLQLLNTKHDWKTQHTFIEKNEKYSARTEARTQDLGFIRPTL